MGVANVSFRGLLLYTPVFFISRRENDVSSDKFITAARYISSVTGFPFSLFQLAKLVICVPPFPSRLCLSFSVLEGGNDVWSGGRCGVFRSRDQFSEMSFNNKVYALIDISIDGQRGEYCTNHRRPPKQHMNGPHNGLHFSLKLSVEFFGSGSDVAMCGLELGFQISKPFFDRNVKFANRFAKITFASAEVL